MSQNYLDAISDNTRILRDVAQGLRTKAQAADQLGMRDFSEQLWEWYQEIWEAQEKISNAVSQELTDQVHEAQSQSATIVRAALAGAQLQTEEPKSTLNPTDMF